MKTIFFSQNIHTIYLLSSKVFILLQLFLRPHKFAAPGTGWREPPCNCTKFPPPCSSPSVPISSLPPRFWFPGQFWLSQVSLVSRFVSFPRKSAYKKKEVGKYVRLSLRQAADRNRGNAKRPFLRLKLQLFATKIIRRRPFWKARLCWDIFSKGGCRKFALAAVSARPMGQHFSTRYALHITELSGIIFFWECCGWKGESRLVMPTPEYRGM